MQLAAAAAPDAAKAPPRPASRLFAILLVPALLAVVLVFDDEILALKGLRGLRTHVRSRIGLPTYGQASPLDNSTVPDAGSVDAAQPLPAQPGQAEGGAMAGAAHHHATVHSGGTNCGDYCSYGKTRAYVGDVSTDAGLDALLKATAFKKEVREGGGGGGESAAANPPPNRPVVASVRMCASTRARTQRTHADRTRSNGPAAGVLAGFQRCAQPRGPRLCACVPAYE